MLWTGADGAAVLWILSADNVFETSFSLGPDAVASITGAWTGKFDSADIIGCYGNTPAQASFTQNGESVVGTLSTSENGCGFSAVAFQGKLHANTLTGTVSGDRSYSGSTATGTLSGTTLEITITNSFGYIPGGSMHLHR